MRQVTVMIKQMMLTMCRIRMMRWMYRNCRLCPKILKHVTVNHKQTLFLFSFTLPLPLVDLLKNLRPVEAEIKLDESAH
jgi:hypothetical protein